MDDLNDIMGKINRFGIECYGHFYSSYPGYVVDNEDPDQMQRVQVILPGILGFGGAPQWAYRKAISPLIQILPQEGDMVWVEFLNGRLDHPIWSHYYPLEANIIKEFKHPKCYGFKSPAGYLALIDEIAKTLDIKTPEGYGINITEKTITIKNDKSTMTIDESGVSVDVGLGDILLYNEDNSIGITDSGVDVQTTKGITLGGQFNVLYSKVPDATQILDVSEIGVSPKVRVG